MDINNGYDRPCWQKRWLNDLKYANARIANFQTRLARLEKVTQSQSNVVVRDTDYQIRRMEDSIECMREFQDLESLAMVDREWAEVKKILTNL